MRSRWLSLLVLLSAVTVQAQTAAPPDDNVLRLTTELVLVDTQVTSQANGKTISGLRAADFIVEEEGRRQELSFFAQDKLPLSVVLLFDLTDTVQPVLKELAKGAQVALQRFKPEDEVAVAVYSNKVQVLQAFTRDHALVLQAIEQAARLDAPEQLALFNEVLFQTAQYQQAQAAPRTRRVVLWLTDNIPNRPPQSVHTENEAFAALLRHDISVSGLLLQNAESKLLNVTKLFMRGAGDLFKYAERTGGEVIKAETENVNQRLAEVIDRVRARYTLGYISNHPTASAGFRRLRVQVAPAVEQREGRVTLRGKAGYFAQSKQTLKSQ